MSLISRNEASKFVNSKATMYNAMIRNDYLLPKKTSSLVSIAHILNPFLLQVSIGWMLKVRKGLIWCPK